MKVYKILHKPTGLFFTPSRGNGNLSSGGKLYPKKPRLEWAGDGIRIKLYTWGNKKPNKNQKKIIDYFELQPEKDGSYWVDQYFDEPVENWEIIEIE